MTNLEELSDEDFVKALTPSVEATITAAYYRVMGQASLPFNISIIERYLSLEQPFKGNIIVLRENNTHLLLWENIDITKGYEALLTDLYVWGYKDGQNVVMTRKGFWRCYVLRGRAEKLLGLPRGTFLTKFDTIRL